MGCLWVEVEFVNVMIGADEVHMLAVTVARIPIKRAARDSAGSLALRREVAVGPLFSRVVKFVDMPIGADVVHMLIALIIPVASELAAGGESLQVGCRVA